MWQIKFIWGSEGSTHPVPFIFIKKSKIMSKNQFILKFYTFFEKNLSMPPSKYKQLRVKRQVFIEKLVFLRRLVFCLFSCFVKQTKESVKSFSHFMLLLNQFQSELLYFVSLLFNYLVIESMFFEESLPYQNDIWGYNFSSMFWQNEYKYLHYTFFFLPSSWFFLEYQPFLPQESLVVKKKPAALFKLLYRFRAKLCVISVYQQIILLYFLVWVWEIRFILILIFILWRIFLF